MAKEPLNINEIIDRIDKSVANFRKAALFELKESGYSSPFQILAACIISIRTRDEATIPVALSLFEKASTPAEVAALEISELDQLISGSTFHMAKAHQIHQIAEDIVNKFDGKLRCDFNLLTSFKGVGPKCANLVLGIACGIPAIGVDIHVHRVTNRWGYVDAPNPEKTMLELERILPEEYWVEINRILVPFGKHICTGTLPKCSICPVLDMCRQIGITKHR